MSESLNKKATVPGESVAENAAEQNASSSFGTETEVTSKVVKTSTKNKKTATSSKATTPITVKKTAETIGANSSETAKNADAGNPETADIFAEKSVGNKPATVKSTAKKAVGNKPKAAKKTAAKLKAETAADDVHSPMVGNLVSPTLDISYAPQVKEAVVSSPVAFSVPDENPTPSPEFVPTGNPHTRYSAEDDDPQSVISDESEETPSKKEKTKKSKKEKSDEKPDASKKPKKDKQDKKDKKTETSDDAKDDKKSDKDLIIGGGELTEDADIETVNKQNLEKGMQTSKGRLFFKILVAFLSGVLTLFSVYLFMQVFDFTNPAELDRIFLVAPLVAQVLIGFVIIFYISLSKKRIRIVQYVQKESKGKDTAGSVRSEREAKKEAENEFNRRVELLRPEIDFTSQPFGSGNFNVETYYTKPVEEINGKLYVGVSPFAESVKALEALGATDLDILRVNMSGSELFNEILNQPRTPTLNSKDITIYFMSKPGAYTIKKRGALNWTFKYSFKSFGIIRENKDGYGVSIKCYPDAAMKLNEKYMALEDSTFPSGPLWFCFTELRNLPPRVCKWLIDTSFQISRFQQIKTDKLRDFKTPADLDINLRDIADRYKNGQNVIVYPKYCLIFTEKGAADLSTYLTRSVEGVDTDDYTKEFYYKFKNKDLAISMLAGKSVSEEMVSTFMEHIEEIFM